MTEAALQIQSSDKAHHHKDKDQYDLLYGHNYALVVIEVLAKYGMDPVQNQIGDIGNIQNSQSNAQNDAAAIAKFWSLVEENSTKDGGLPPHFFDKGVNPGNYQILMKMKSAYKDLFHGSAQNIDIKDGKLYITIDGKSTPMSLTSGPMKKLMKAMNAELKKVFGSNFNLNMSGHESDIEVYIFSKLQYALDKAPNKEQILYDFNHNPDKFVTDILKGNSKYPALFNPAKDTNIQSFGQLWQDFHNSNFTINYQGQDATLGTLLDENAPLGDISGVVFKIAKDYANKTGGSGSGSCFLKDFYGDLSQTQSYLQAATQENTSLVQQFSSELTSYDQTGQSMVQTAAKGVTDITQNQKSY